jgi:hypothetical protein
LLGVERGGGHDGDDEQNRGKRALRAKQRGSPENSKVYH